MRITCQFGKIGLLGLGNPPLRWVFETVSHSMQAMPGMDDISEYG